MKALAPRTIAIAAVVSGFAAALPAFGSFFFLANDLDLLGPVDLGDWTIVDLSPRARSFTVPIRLMVQGLFPLLGVRAWAFAALCLAIHASVAWLAYRWYRSAEGRGAAPLYAAAAFAVLPSHVFLYTRLTNALVHGAATACLLGALLAVRRYSRTGRRGWLAGAVVCELIGSQFHELALLAPALALLWPAGARSTRRERIGAAALALAAAPGLCLAIGTYLGSWSDVAYSPAGYAPGFHAARNAARLALGMVWPSDGVSPVALAAAALAAALLAGDPGRPRSRGLLSCALLLAPFTPFLVLPFPDPARYAYAGSVFFCLALGAAAARETGRGWRKPAFALLLAAGAAKSAALTWHLRSTLEPARRFLDGVAPAACAHRGSEPLEIVWPEAGRYWVHEERLQRYLRARCRRADLAIQLSPR